MGKMPRNEDRELLIESYEKTHDAEEIAKIFGVNKYTVYHCLKQSPVRFCVSVNGIASAGLKLMDIACNLGNCYNTWTSSYPASGDGSMGPAGTPGGFAGCKCPNWR